MRGHLTETFKIINRISDYVRPFFNISPQMRNSLSRQISKTKSNNQLDFLRIFFEQIKLPNQIKNSESVENFKNWIEWF